jgi:hypothetical protein
MQQKDASPHLTKLWQQDPFKAKWAIIAKAYSIIRDAVGKVAAPLDLFLNQVCPEIGIISIDEYLHKMKWEFVTALDGMVSLQQTSAPDLSSFDERITRTVMTEWEVISFAENNGYMPRNTVVPNVQMTQQGVFAGFAGIPPPAPFANNNLAPVLSGMNMFLQDVAMNPAAAATMVLGFDVEDMLREPNTHQVKWTGSMADLYDPETGFLDLERNVENKWDVANIDDPQSFDSIFTDSIQDGYLIPNGNVMIKSELEINANINSSGVRRREPRLSLKG